MDESSSEIFKSKPKELKRKLERDNYKKKMKRKQTVVPENEQKLTEFCYFDENSEEYNGMDKEMKKSTNSSPPSVKLVDLHDSPGNIKDDKKTDFDIINGWQKEDIIELLKRIEMSIPKNDSRKYNSTVKKLDWEMIQFGSHSPEECQGFWNYIEKRMRGYRILQEIVNDAKEWINKPWTDFYQSNKKNRHPDMPKRPLSSYILFYQDKRDKYLKKYPGKDMIQISKKIAKKFRNLTAEEKAVYELKAENFREEYNIQMEKFMKEHPQEAANFKMKKKKETDKFVGPQKPKTPFRLYLDNKLKHHIDDAQFSQKQLLSEYQQKWKNLSSKKKIPWIRWAQEAEIKYMEELKVCQSENPGFEMPKYKSVLSKEEKTILERIEGKPEKPPNSAYSLFSRIMLRDPNLIRDYKSPKERMQRISVMWKDISSNEKEAYVEKVKDLIQNYKLEFASYLETLPETRRNEELAKIKPKRKTKILEPKSPKGNFFEREPKHPPKNAKHLFKEFYIETHKKAKNVNITKEWTKLSQEERKKFRQKHEAMKQKYIIQFKNFLNSLSKTELKAFCEKRGTIYPNTNDMNDLSSDYSSDDQEEKDSPNSEEDYSS